MTIDNLRREANTRLRTAFLSAVRETETTLRQRPSIPLDTSALQQGIERNGNTFVTGAIKKATISSTATNSGFDYPAHLNSRTRRYLNANTVGGSTATHLQWWERALGVAGGEDIWGPIIEKHVDDALGRI